MKNKRIVKIGIVLGVATAIFLAVLNITGGTKPFKELVAEDIVSATVEITPPGETVEIKNTEQLAEYLKDIVVYREDHSYQEYAGQSIIFTPVSYTHLDVYKRQFKAQSPAWESITEEPKNKQNGVLSHNVCVSAHCCSSDF